MDTKRTRHHDGRSWAWAWLQRRWTPTDPEHSAEHRARLPGQTAPALATWTAPR